MTILLIIIVVVVLIALATPVIMTFITVRGMSDPQLVSHLSQEQVNDFADQWAGENEFGFVGNFSIKVGIVETTMAIWRRADRPSFFCRYTVQAGNNTQTSYDFVTIFDGDIMLTTNNKADSQMLPQPPGYYAQSLSLTSLDDQWYQHVEMENYLMDAGGALLVQFDKPFENCLVDVIRKQVAYVQSIPGWPLRGIYWFYVRRKIRYNLTIKDQRDKGLIRLPRELPGFRNTSGTAIASDANQLDEVTSSV